jgi:hypothetical protein
VKREFLKKNWVRCQWLMPVIFATQETRDQENHGSKPAPGKKLGRTYLEKILHKRGLVEWLK